MRVVTIVSLAASAVLGLGALFVAKVALPNSAAARGIPALAQGSPLVVAARPLKYGEKLNASMLTVIKAPKNAIPAGSFTTVEQVLGADHGGPPVVLVPLVQHEAMLTSKISGPGARPTVAAEIADGMRAYSFKVTDATGVGGHALPGDHVDVVLLRDLTPQGPERTYISYVVLQNARVLGVDLNADPSSEKPASPSTATLEVSVEDSQKLSMASTLGTLSLALRKSGSAEVASTPPMRAGDFLGGPSSAGVRPAGGVRTAMRGPAAPAYSGILIIEGASSKRGGSRAKAAPTPAFLPTTGVGAAADGKPGAAAADAIG